MKSNDSKTPDETPIGNPGAPTDELKREFLKRFGKYAATAPAALYLLMSARTSNAQWNSDGGPPPG